MNNISNKYCEQKATSLEAETEVSVRFCEVDSMGIVWHGSYVKYFEDGREAFGKKYGIGYLDIFGNGFYAPLVDLDFKFKKPLIYGKKAIVKTRYINSDAAKLIFEYEIVSAEDGSIIATGSSTQVFLNKSYELILSCPDFYLDWKKKNGLIVE